MFKNSLDGRQLLYEQEEDSHDLYLGGVSNGQGPLDNESEEEQEVLLDPSIEVINLEAKEQPRAFMFSSDEDEEEVDTYL